VKPEELIRYLSENGCEFLREDGRHSWWWNPKLNKRSSVPRHTEIRNVLANKICKDLGIERIR
jgi:mRNA interferase HicA